MHRDGRRCCSVSEQDDARTQIDADDAAAVSFYRRGVITSLLLNS